MTRKGRVHLITGGLLLGLILIIVILWSNPMILVWVLLGLMAVMAYGVLYLLVQARMPKPDEEADDASDSDDVDTESEPDFERESARPASTVESPRVRVRRAAAPPRETPPSHEVSPEVAGRSTTTATTAEALSGPSPPKPRAPRRPKRSLP